jgi:hypothetical protein
LGARGAIGIDFIVAQHKTVILHHRAAAGRSNYDSIEIAERGPGVDIGLYLHQCLGLTTQVMG